MKTLARNPGCRNLCHFDRESETGFVAELGCVVHDRAGYEPFRISWVNGRPWCLGSLTIMGEGDLHAHAMFALGLN